MAGVGWKQEGKQEAAHAGRVARRGWRMIQRRVRRAVREHDLSIVAGGIAFYTLVGLFPAFLAAGSVYGALVGEEQAMAAIESLGEMLPAQLEGFVTGQLETIVGQGLGRLSLSLVLGLIGAVWSVSTGMHGVIRGLDVAFACDETRSTLRRRALALVLSVAGLALTVVALAAVVLVPGILTQMNVTGLLRLAVGALRWILLALLAMVALAALYRYGPDRKDATWRWSSWGAVIAVLVWIVASLVFSLWMAYTGKITEQYGSMGAPVFLLVWLFVTSFIVLLGAEINAAIEDIGEGGQPPR